MSSRKLVPFATRFLAGMAIATLTLTSFSAFALFRRIHALSCTGVANISTTGDGYLTSSNESQGHIICPVDSWDGSDAKDYHSFNMHYYDGHDGQSVSGQPCVTFYGSLGGACAGKFTPDQNGATGTLEMHYPNNNFWASYPSDFQYIDFYLTQRNCTGTWYSPGYCYLSQFFGAWLSNT